MTSTTTPSSAQVFEFLREEVIDAPADIVFQAIIDEITTEFVMPDGSPMPLKLEAFPGGRWFRDLGNNTGHFWGHVQVIKPPTLLELCGPMFMSYAASNHVQYRLTTEGTSTRLKLRHNSIGLFTPEHCANMQKGWTFKFNRIVDLSQRAAIAK